MGIYTTNLPKINVSQNIFFTNTPQRSFGDRRWQLLHMKKNPKNFDFSIWGKKWNHFQHDIVIDYFSIFRELLDQLPINYNDIVILLVEKFYWRHFFSPLESSRHVLSKLSMYLKMEKYSAITNLCKKWFHLLSQMLKSMFMGFLFKWSNCHRPPNERWGVVKKMFWETLILDFVV